MILKRNVDDRYSTILRRWEGSTAILIGGGPSLTKAQIAMVSEAQIVKDYHVIAVNDAYLWAPHADVLYAADYRWWGWHAAGIAKPALGLTAGQVRERFEAFVGERCSIRHGDSVLHDELVHVLKNLTHPDHGDGLSRDQGAISTGRNSIFQALNIAVLAGVRRALLLGVDGKEAADGRTHFHGGHPAPTPYSLFFEAMRKSFAASEASIKESGVEVLNCSPGSAIDAFPKVSLEEALNGVKHNLAA